MELKNRMRVMRAEHDLTQEALARAVGVSRQTILSIENGIYTPSLSLGMRIARYFGKPVEEVFQLAGR